MFFEKNYVNFFSFICIATLVSCSDHAKQNNHSEKKFITGEIMENQKNQIKLYSYPHCPYCKKVINYLKSINQICKNFSH